MSTNTFPAVDQQSSTAAPRRSNTPSPSLQRGKACLSCRRRKMKCDGQKPVCTPCLRGERAEDCEYTDGPRRPRTLTLEEDIARLRARVQELENPEDVPPSVQLHAPYAGPGTTSTSVPRQGRPHGPLSGADSPHALRQLSGGPSEPHRADVDGDAHTHARRALSVITPYAAELGFFLDMEHLRVQGTHILPALQSVLTLWSVHITSVSDLDRAPARERSEALASYLLSQTQTQLASALSTVDAEPDPAIHLHLVQTGILLAYYMQRIGQKVGARYYASGTWALATMLKLHQGPHFLVTAGVDERVSRGGAMRERLTGGNMNVCAFTLAACARWAQPLDGVEAEERVRAFWAAYALDRWFSAVCEGSRQSLSTDGSTGHAVTVPWPGAGGESEAVTNTVQNFLSNPSHDFTQDGVAAMHAKASVLLGESTAIAASYVADHAISQSPAFRTRFGTLDTLLQRCLSTAMTLSAASHGRQSQEQGQVLVTIHLVALAHVTLHRVFISTYAPSRRRCIEGALGVVRVLDRMGEVGATSPIYAVVWTGLCLALHPEVVRLRARPDADPSRRREEGETEAIRRLVGILSALSQRCPSQFFAANIEAVLPVLESIAI